MVLDHEALMRLAIAEAELARGTTGDNPWVGCVICDENGDILGRGHTRGPGEDHAEIGALREADAQGKSVLGATMYSTLEPCSFHGRTPACSRVIIERGIGRLVYGMRDPNPRVDGEGVNILRAAGVEVLEFVCEAEVRKQLGSWVIAFHPHEFRRRALALRTSIGRVALAAALTEAYAIDGETVAELLRGLND
jgi:diaminohydroxyphosphoribosylaminopyrimidine deaminase/5-amino-6-(5-phosphoribosylamino)uracil reductase